MRLRVEHSSTYRFEPPMRGVVQSLRLRPSQCENQAAVDWLVTVDGASVGSGFRDGAGDWVETAMLLGPVETVTVNVQGVVQTTDMGGVLRGHRERIHPEAYLRPTRATRAERTLIELASSAIEGISPEADLDRAHALCHGVRDAITYTPGKTEHGTTAAEALALGHGVCQDHAHTLVAVALIAGIPARYVTGYLFSSEEDADHEASHAWAELFLKDLGWVGFDASNGTCPDDRYIRIGSGGDASEASPIRSIARGASEEVLDVTLAVNQVQQ
ncbi:MAG: transglutaminase family protein [Pseudomonadota bacterium]